MLSFEKVITQSFFPPVSNAEIRNLLNKFTLNPEGKDGKGLNHTLYGDPNGGAHMCLNDENLKIKIEELEEKHSRVKNDQGKGIKYLNTLKEELNKLDVNSAGYAEKEKRYNEELEKFEKKDKCRVKARVKDEIRQIKTRSDQIIKNKENGQENMHNFFPPEWGPLEIKDVITDILKDKKSTITKILTPEMGEEEKAARSSGSREMRVHGPSWEVKGKYNGLHIGYYNEISMRVIIAMDSDSQAMKLISAYPENRVEKKQALPRTLGLSN